MHPKSTRSPRTDTLLNNSRRNPPASRLLRANCGQRHNPDDGVCPQCGEVVSVSCPPAQPFGRQDVANSPPTASVPTVQREPLTPPSTPDRHLPPPPAPAQTPAPAPPPFSAPAPAPLPFPFRLSPARIGQPIRHRVTCTRPRWCAHRRSDPCDCVRSSREEADPRSGSWTGRERDGVLGNRTWLSRLAGRGHRGHCPVAWRLPRPESGRGSRCFKDGDINGNEPRRRRLRSKPREGSFQLRLQIIGCR